jgi:hypothetical protein
MGQMNVHQMVRHCSLSEEMMLGKKKYKRNWLGVLFGKMAMKAVLRNEKPMMRNSPTVPELKLKETGHFETEKAKWISLLEEHANSSRPEILHPFFGRMTMEQIDYVVYKHTDHHLRQFNV